VTAIGQRKRIKKKATTNCSGPALDSFAIRDHDLPADTMGYEHKGSEASSPFNAEDPPAMEVTRLRATNSRRRRLQDRNRPHK